MHSNQVHRFAYFLCVLFVCNTDKIHVNNELILFYYIFYLWLNVMKKKLGQLEKGAHFIKFVFALGFIIKKMNEYSKNETSDMEWEFCYIIFVVKLSWLLKIYRNHRVKWVICLEISWEMGDMKWYNRWKVIGFQLKFAKLNRWLF